MSKLLIKILSICALVVLLPLVVVGASLSVTEAVGCSLTVAFAGDEGSADKTGTNQLTSSVVIKVDGKVQDTTTIKVAKYSEVTVVYSGEGYNFKGWYEGEYYEKIQDEKQPVDKKAEYTFELTHDTVLTAVRDIKKYTIHYTGFYDDGTTEVELPDEIREYNESLASLTPVAHGTWGGWREVSAAGNEIGTTVKFANFTSPEVTLTAKWDDVMVVKYMDGGNELLSQTVSKYNIENHNHELPDTDNSLVKVPTGYKFLGWKDAQGTRVESITEFDPNGLTLYLDKELIVYNITVYENDNQQFANEITYDVEKGFVGLTEKVKKEGYQVKSYKFNNTSYESLDNLAIAILQSAETNIDLTVEWKLSKVTLTVKFNAKSDDTATITYNDVDKTFSQYGVTREGYRLVGLKFKGQTYNYANGTYEGLGDAIMAEGAETVEVTAVWESEYGTYNFYVFASYYDTTLPQNPEKEAWVDGRRLDEEATVIQFVDEEAKPNAVAKDLQDNIFDEYIGSSTISKDAEASQTLTFTGDVVITMKTTNGTTKTFTLAGLDTSSTVLTYFKVLAFLEESVSAELFADLQDVTITFIYE